MPISYINIIVDVINAKHETAVTVHQNLLPDTYHKVLYTFQGQMEGDLSVVEGEVVRVVEKQNEDWYVVENCSGEAGLFPGNHLDPNPEFSGKSTNSTYLTTLSTSEASSLVFRIDRILGFAEVLCVIQSLKQDIENQFAMLSNNNKETPCEIVNLS